MDELEKKAQRGLDSFKESGDMQSVKNRLDGMVDEMLGEEDDAASKSKVSRTNKWIYFVIALLGLALIGYLGYRDGSKTKNEKTGPVLYAQYFEVLPDMTSSNERSSENDEREIQNEDQGMAHYNSKNYKDAAILLKNENDIHLVVYAAIAEMKNSNFEEAIDLFLECQKKDEEGLFKDITSWYLSLSYLRIEKYAKASDGMKMIAETENHYKKDQALAILKKMDER